MVVNEEVLKFYRLFSRCDTYLEYYEVALKCNSSRNSIWELTFLLKWTVGLGSHSPSKGHVSIICKLLCFFGKSNISTKGRICG